MAATEPLDGPQSAAAPARHGEIGVLGAAALVAGGMVGSGIYVLPASMGAIGSISILGWLGATAAALSIAAVFALLGRAAPQATGLPSYVQAGLGPFFGVQMTFTYWVANWVGLVPVALAAAGVIGYLVPGLAGEGPRLALTLASIWLAVALCWFGPRAVTRFEGVTLAVGLLPVLLMAVFGWLAFRPEVFLASWNPQGLSTPSATITSALTAFYAFLGVECAAAAAGVVRDPTRNVARATLLGVVGVAVLYIAVCAVLMGILPAAKLAASSTPFADAAQTAFGFGLAGVIAICSLLRAQGCITGWTLVAAETTRSGADEGAFPSLFRTRPGERASPVNLLSMGVLMSLVAVGSAAPTFAEQFSTLANITVILSLYGYALAALSLVRLSRAFSPGRRAIGIGTAAAAIAASIGLVATAKPSEQLISLIPLAAAALLYFWLRRR